MSTRLAAHLRELGVGVESLVPICFEKSMWTVVAMLAIMKAGGAFVPVNPSHPPARIRALVAGLDAPLILASPATAHVCEDVALSVVEVSGSLVSRLPQVTALTGSGPAPASAAYVIFTSSSTGTPKGVVIEHRAIASSITNHATVFSIGSSSRVLQFASYVFDGCISEIFISLCVGGTVCVPSDEARLSNVTDFISLARVDCALLTPSFASTFSPSLVPTLNTLVLGGETLLVSDLRNWRWSLRLMNGYGAAEACNYASAHDVQDLEASASTIGRGCNAVLWIVEPDDHDRLAPLGCIGELMIQGPGLAREYLNDPGKTAQSFIESPSWLPPSPFSRLYKTGDLVRYNDDGTIEYVGRKDVQIKVRGQRVEPGEVEYHVRQYLGPASGASVQLVDGARADGGVLLVVFTCMDTQADAVAVGTAVAALSLDDSTMERLRGLDHYLRSMLPDYMVPSHALPIQRLPLTSSGKIDGGLLRQTVVSLTAEELTTYALSTRGKIRPPVTQMEQEVREMWSQILKLPVETIGRDDSFLQLGGDSITVIRLVAMAREQGIELSVTSIFKDPRLSGVAASAHVGDVAAVEQLELWSLVPARQRSAIEQDVQAQCMLATMNGQTVSDVYPTTAFQEGLMALAVKQPGSYMARFHFELATDVDIPQLQAAWEQTLQACPALRTRIVLSGGASWQAVIDEKPEWGSADSLAGYMARELTNPMEYGSALCRYAMLFEGEHRVFGLTLHHAIFDGWSLGLIMRALSGFYDGSGAGETAPLAPYAGFVKFARALDVASAEAYWQEQLKAASRPVFPRLPNGSAASSAAPSAIVLARYSDDTDDITFGAAVAGRQAPVAGVERMVGPVIATVPVRVKLCGQQPIAQYLHDIQAQGAEMIPFEQMGLQNIAKLGPDAREACAFSSLFVIQPEMIARGTASSLFQASDDVATAAVDSPSITTDYFTYPLVMQCHLHDSGIVLHVTFDSSILGVEQIKWMMVQYEHVVQQLYLPDSQGDRGLVVDDLTLCGPQDLTQMRSWNADVETAVVPTCFHTLVEEQARRRPSAPAIAAWDGDFSYSELDAAADRLARHLVRDWHIAPGDLVVLCFEKSAWVYVAMLAVNKAGGAWVPLDPSHPSRRHQQVIEQAGARVALASPEHASKCRLMLESVVEVSPALDQWLADTHDSREGLLADLAGPRDVAYVLFTSGTTGTPKGIVMEHRSLCTSQTAISRRLGLEAERVRTLQFAAYVFDLSIGEIVAPLISGACVCVPSEHERVNDLAGFVRRARVN
nr:nonribosomal peptide synthetase dtxs1 [Quercus suber]